MSDTNEVVRYDPFKGAEGNRGMGRTSGVPNKRTQAFQEHMVKVSKQIGQVLGEGAFQGDAHAFLMAVYRDSNVPLDMRIEAASVAIRYEKPALQAVAMKTTEQRTISITLTPDDGNL